MKSIKQVKQADKVNMGGILLDQPLPNSQFDHIDPFLLIHHWKSTVPGNQKQQDAGVGPHPHRGFSPVTFIYKGGVHHQDSKGNNHIVYEGGTQWMDTGRGIVHSERPYKELAEKGGDFEIIQLWINTPQKHKMDQPRYQPLTAEDTPRVYADNQKVNIGVVAGQYEGQQGPIDTYFDLLVLRINMTADSQTTLSIPQHFNTLLYQLEGLTLLNEAQHVYDKTMVVFEQDDETIHIAAKQSTEILFLAGQPLNEKIKQYGPFVMNTQTEILEALRDAQMGKMGVLIESF